MLLPQACGPVSAGVIDYLRSGQRGPGGAVRDDAVLEAASAVWPGDIFDDEDAQLSLWTLYELHYRSFDDADERGEWDPYLLEVRSRLEAPFEAAIRAEVVPQVEAVLDAEGDFADRLFTMVAAFDGPPVAEHVQRRASREQIRELILLRSVYHLKEADPHSWAIPRLTGAAKAGLVELQFDEYGDGQAERVHQDLFAETLRGVGLDDRYGAYVDDVPASILAVSNAMSLFGLHRRLRGAVMGHLGAFEATSSVPCARFAAGIRRVGFSDSTAFYFDEHVEADAIHEQLAFRGICASLVEAEPALGADVALGAAACLTLDARTGTELLAAWSRGDQLVIPPPEVAVEGERT